MRLLLQILSAVFVLLIASLSIIVLAARTQPITDHLALLHLDQCAPPCWIGLTPGQRVKPGEVEAALSKAYPAPQFTLLHDDNCLSESDHCYYIVSDGKRLFRAQISQGSTRRESDAISLIYLNFDDRFVHHSDYTFGEFYALFGSPDTSRIVTSFKYPRHGELQAVIYYRPDSQLILNGFDGDLTTDPTKRVSSIMFATQNPLDLTESELQSQQARITPWKGYMSNHRLWMMHCLARGSC